MKYILLFCFFLFVTNVSAQQNIELINNYYNQGIEAYKAKDYPKFLDCFIKLDSLRSNNAAIMYNLACAYSLNENKEEAIKYLRKYISINANANIEKDNDFNNIKNSSEFKAVVNKIKEFNQPINTSKIAFIIDEKDLHPESIAYDDSTNTFYLSSIHKRKIISVDKDGNTNNFVSEKQDGLCAVSGIKINSKDRLLWAATEAIPQMIGYEDSLEGFTAVFKYDLDSQKLLKKYYAPNDSNEHYFGDLTINKNGDVYVSDSKYPAIYLINNNSNQLELFYENKDLRSLQGLDFSDSGNELFFADYASGIYKLDIHSKKLSRLNEPEGISLKGIDGLYFYKNSLIAIQNGVIPNRVTKYLLNEDQDKIRSFEIIERANPNFNEPTLGILVKDSFYYIANSQWESYNKDGSIFPMDKLQKIMVLKTQLAE